MIRRAGEKLREQGGLMSRMVALLLVLVAVMLVVLLIPGFRWMNEQGELHSCEQAIDTAWRRMSEDYIMNSTTKLEDVKSEVSYAMGGWDDICPGGGKVYLIRTRKNADRHVQRGQGALPYELVCGKHDRDTKLRTRLNADDLLRQLREKLLKLRRNGEEYPESITLTYNGKPLKAVLVDEASGLKRGTSTTAGLEKEEAVAYYSIVGHSSFGQDSGEEEGEVWYFSFADQQHCANWRSDDGWTGDSYQGLSQ